MRYRLSYADVAELLAERGVRVDPSSIYAWVQQFAPLYEAARAYRLAIGDRWSVDETYVKVAGEWAYVYRALDEQGQVVDVYVSAERAAEDAATFFRRAIEATGTVPTEVATDCAAAYPPALAAVLPDVLHETGKRPQQRIERVHQHLKGRVCGMHGFKTLAGTRVLCRGHAFLRNLRRGFYDLEAAPATTSLPGVPATVSAWEALTAEGLDNATIAARLGLAQTTVMSYWTVIYSTLRLTKQPQKKARAIEQWQAWQRGEGAGGNAVDSPQLVSEPAQSHQKHILHAKKGTGRATRPHSDHHDDQG